ncbi:aldo/keto reductase [Verrucomicrobia bacterium S94]|nr:aldo/keto reductase [Verrucomicrobia bacterium S94]
MLNTSRRNFALPLIGTAAFSASAVRSEEVPASPPQVTLGNTGIIMSRMGFGTGVKAGRKKSIMTRKGYAEFVGMFQHCYDRGITFFDLADWYGSHPYCREALRTIPRDNVSLLTKFWFRSDGNISALSVAQRKQSAKKALERFLEELNVEHVDMLLLHCLVKKNWVEEMQPYMDVFSKAKAEGKIRALGVSCHDFGAMETAAALSWVDIMLARLNPYGVKCDAEPAEVLALLKRAKANGKGIIGMKIYGEGQLVDKREQCMKYAQNCGALDAMTIGAVTPQEVDENLRLMAEYPAVSV